MCLNPNPGHKPGHRTTSKPEYVRSLRPDSILPSVLVPPMSDVSRVLNEIEAGDPHAAEQLLPLVYEELRKLAYHKLAKEAPGQTLQSGVVAESVVGQRDDEPGRHLFPRAPRRLLGRRRLGLPVGLLAAL